MIGDVSASGSVTGHTGPERSCEVGVRQGDRNDHVVLAVRGILPAPFGDAAFRRTLGTQLLDRGRVVVDLSEATVESDPVVQVFPAALADAGGWPLARLVLARPDPLTARILQAARMHLTVPLASTLAGAQLLLDARPSRVARDHELPCDSTAPGLARMAVASMCEDWELDDGVYDAAATVATELVSNAVDHADTASVLHLALDRRHLQIAVGDSRPVTEGRPHTAAPCDRRYGLLIVQGLSRGWGVSPYAGGKIVWALLDAEPE